MTSVAIVSNCQSKALADAMAALLPSGEVEAFNLGQLATPAKRERALEAIGGKDVVFVMPFGTDGDTWSSDTVARAARRPVMLPQVVFRGFHPDMTYLSPPLHNHPSPIGDYHSIITVAGFVSGRSVGQTIRLFNPLVYARLGYLDLHVQEEAELVASFAEHGIDIGAAVARWRRRGCFMHSLNHPMPFVIHELARMALLHARLHPADADLNRLPDTLGVHERFPIYPEIAARLGLPGSTDFKLRASPGQESRFMGLEAFVAGSFARYAGLRPAELAEAIGVRRALAQLAG